MQQSFIIIVQGHTLEFNRILYPTKYAILSHDVVHAGVVIVAEKDEGGMWCIGSLLKLPKWVNEIASDIYKAIEEKECSLHDAYHI